MATVTSYFKGEFFLNNLDAPCGVTEVYYPSGGTDDDCIVQMRALWALRKVFLPENWFLAYCRVSATGKPRDSVAAPDIVGEAGTYVLGTGTLMASDTCFLATLVGDPFGKNRKFLHGATNIDVANGDTLDASPTFSAAVNAWIGELVADFLITKRHIVPPNPWDKVSYDQQPIVDGSVDRVTNHKCGRPFGLFRGRRRRVM